MKNMNFNHIFNPVDTKIDIFLDIYAIKVVTLLGKLKHYR